ncbi:hypothetical protein A9Q81_08840 [Gammaproteobacteria bacterium 42_54_T18]|nr:hypothetical protein A9Q81_08840 [Gammaproteobacteria bacterium 42_54_T18]
MLRLFRAISIMEGVSYLAILSVTLGLISRDYVSQIGMGHGVLFMFYLFLSIFVSDKQGWSLKIWLPLFFASIIPFAFFLVELYLRKGFESEGLPETSA